MSSDLPEPHSTPHIAATPRPGRRVPRRVPERPAGAGDPERAATLAARAQRIVVTRREAVKLQAMPRAMRDAWVARHVPPKERLARFLADEDLPHWIVHNARRGRYAPGESTYEDPRGAFVAHLVQVGRSDIAELVTAGAFDTPAPPPTEASDA